jgi:hypothetical protein
MNGGRREHYSRFALKKNNNARPPLSGRAHCYFFLLSDQVSNLDSSEPKSDVLPVTPSDSFPPVTVREHKYKRIISEKSKHSRHLNPKKG